MRRAWTRSCPQFDHSIPRDGTDSVAGGASAVYLVAVVEMTPARRRLEHVHKLWHGALDEYPDVDVFCLSVNALIQAERTVTWLVQKAFKHAPGFEEWYGPWQQRLRDDVVMTWLVEARNRIEKQGDLEMRSTARVSIVASWLEAPFTEFDVFPLIGPAEIAARVREGQIPDELRREGTIRVERRWVTESLPNLELLEACAHGFGVLNEIVSEAESEFLGMWPNGHPSGRPACMIAGVEARTARLRIDSGVIIAFEAVPEVIDEDKLRQVEERYGEMFRDVRQTGDTLLDRVRWHHEVGRRMMEIDGGHRTIGKLYRSGQSIGIVGLDAEDQHAKYALLELFAADAAGKAADEVILSSEAWMAHELPSGDERSALRAGQRWDKGEAFVTYGMSRAGDVIALISVVERENGKLVLSDPTEQKVMPNVLLPIRRAWDSLAVPSRSGSSDAVDRIT